MIITESGVVIRENTEIALSREQLRSFRRLLELAAVGKVQGISIKHPPQKGGDKKGVRKWEQ